MKKLKLKKIIAVILAAVSISTLHVLNADAAWIKDSNGWWNTEGDSWSVGWRLIDNEWYYFDSQGYMKTGWLLDGGKWYYLSADGAMAKDTTIDDYKIGADGAWIDNREEKNTSQNNTNKENTSVENNNNNSAEAKDLTMDGFISLLKNKGYNPEIKDAEKGFLAGERKIINIGDENLEVYTYGSNEEMEKDAAKINYGGFSYKKTIGKSIHLSWDSYPHFYKNSNMITLYVGKNEKIINDLNNILGHHFIGIESQSNLASIDDVRKVAYTYLSEQTQKNLEGGWKEAKILDSSELEAIDKDEYLIVFVKKPNDTSDNLISLTVDKNTFKFLEFWERD